ncbi:MAG: hypothetical protein JSW54_02290, partial [Fidelibacterota bacterium]
VVRDSVAPPDTGDILASLSTDELTRFARGLNRMETQFDFQQFRSGDLVTKHQLIREAVRQITQSIKQDSSLFLAELLRHWPDVMSYEPYWRSRRGLSEQARVVFLYGLPARIESHPATSIEREYQTWTYAYQDSTDQFVFLDRKGYGEFDLVHATLPGGRSNENWEREIPWIPVPVDTTAIPVAEQVGVEPVAPPVDTTMAPPAAVDTVPAPELPTEVETVQVDTAAVAAQPADTSPVDTAAVEPMPVPELPLEQDSVQVDTAAVEVLPADTSSIDTTGTDSLQDEPSLIDTTQVP